MYVSLKFSENATQQRDVFLNFLFNYQFCFMIQLNNITIYHSIVQQHGPLPSITSRCVQEGVCVHVNNNKKTSLKNK